MKIEKDFSHLKANVKMVKKKNIMIISGLLIFLIVNLVALPVAGSQELIELKDINLVEKDNSFVLDYDQSIVFYCPSTAIMISIFNILGADINIMQLDLGNSNNFEVTYHLTVTLKETKDNRVLDTFEDYDSMEPLSQAGFTIYHPSEWKSYGYTFGPFDLICDINVPEIESDFTVVFHGFVIGGIYARILFLQE